MHPYWARFHYAVGYGHLRKSVEPCQEYVNARVLSGRREALRIVDFVRDLPVVVVVEPGATHQSLLYLPFLVPSPEFFIQDRETFERLAKAFDAGPLRPKKCFEHLTMSVVDAAGRTWAVIEYH